MLIYDHHQMLAIYSIAALWFYHSFPLNELSQIPRYVVQAVYTVQVEPELAESAALLAVAAVVVAIAFVAVAVAAVAVAVVAVVGIALLPFVVDCIVAAVACPYSFAVVVATFVDVVVAFDNMPSAVHHDIVSMQLDHTFDPKNNIVVLHHDDSSSLSSFDVDRLDRELDRRLDLVDRSNLEWSPIVAAHYQIFDYAKVKVRNYDVFAFDLDPGLLDQSKHPMLTNQVQYVPYPCCFCLFHRPYPISF